MRAPLFVVALVGAVLATLAAVVYALNDETLFVSPPEMVATELVHAISLGRTESARQMMSREAQREASPRALRRVASAWRARVGPTPQTEGEVVERRGDTVVVRVAVDSDRAKPELLVRLVREAGVWSAARLEDLLPADAGTAAAPAGR